MVMLNTIISNTSSGNGIVFAYSSGTSISYCDFYDNNPSNFLGSGPSGLGNVNSTNANGDPCDQYYNIFLQPMFANPVQGDCHLTAGSPCVDAGDPSLPLDPDSTVSDIGRFFYDQSAVLPDIEVSADTLDFGEVLLGECETMGLTISNLGEGELMIYDISCALIDIFTIEWDEADTIIAPGASINISVTFEPAEEIEYADVLTIDNNDELVEMTLWGCGITLGINDNPVLNQPAEYRFKAPYPNPFNPKTTLQFNLREAGHTALIVYDTQGQEVARLLDSWMAEGAHSVSFDASALPSGVYFARLHSGNFSGARKLLLIK